MFENFYHFTEKSANLDNGFLDYHESDITMSKSANFRKSL